MINIKTLKLGSKTRFCEVTLFFDHQVISKFKFVPILKKVLDPFFTDQVHQNEIEG